MICHSIFNPCSSHMKACREGLSLSASCPFSASGFAVTMWSRPGTGAPGHCGSAGDGSPYPTALPTGLADLANGRNQPVLPRPEPTVGVDRLAHR